MKTTITKAVAIDALNRAWTLCYQGSFSFDEAEYAQAGIEAAIALYEEVARSIDEIAAREADCGSPPLIADRLRKLLEVRDETP